MEERFQEGLEESEPNLWNSDGIKEANNIKSQFLKTYAAMVNSHLNSADKRTQSIKEQMIKLENLAPNSNSGDLSVYQQEKIRLQTYLAKEELKILLKIILVLCQETLLHPNQQDQPQEPNSFWSQNISPLFAQNSQSQEEEKEVPERLGVLYRTFTYWRAIAIEILKENLKNYHPAVENKIFHKFIVEVDGKILKKVFIKKVRNYYQIFTSIYNNPSLLGGVELDHHTLKIVSKCPQYQKFLITLQEWAINVELAHDLINRIKLYGFIENNETNHEEEKEIQEQITPNEDFPLLKSTDIHTEEIKESTFKEWKSHWKVQKKSTVKGFLKSQIYNLAISINTKMASSLKKMVVVFGLKQFIMKMGISFNFLLFLIGRSSILTSISLPLLTYSGIMAGGLISALLLHSASHALDAKRARSNLEYLTNELSKVSYFLSQHISRADHLIQKISNLKTENKASPEEITEATDELRDLVNSLEKGRPTEEMAEEEKLYEAMKQLRVGHSVLDYLQQVSVEDDWVLINKINISQSKVQETLYKDFISLSIKDNSNHALSSEE